MGNSALSRLERVYLQPEVTYGVVPGNPAGTDACHHVRFSANNDTPLIERPDKTGSRGTIAGVPGRRACRWSIEMGLTGGPRAHPLLLSTFGASGGAGQYNIADVIKSFTAWDYRQPATMAQRCAHGLVVSEATWTLGQDQAATWQAQGEGLWNLYSDCVDVADTEQLGGLGAFPIEPVPSWSDSGLIVGFTGVATFDGSPLASIRQAQIRFATNNQLVRDTFGHFYATGTQGGVRQVGVSFSLYDDDDAAVTNLRKKAQSKTPINIVLQVGTTNKWTFTINNVQLGSETLNDQQLRWTSDWTEGIARETTPGACDEMTLAVTQTVV